MTQNGEPLLRVGGLQIINDDSSPDVIIGYSNITLYHRVAT